MLSGIACPGPGVVSAGAGAVLVLLLHAYTLAAAGDSSPSRLFPSVYASFRQPFRLCSVPPYYHSIRRERARRFLFCFGLCRYSLLYLRFPWSILRYSLFFGLFAPLFSLSVCLILSFCLSFLYYCGASFAGGRSVMRVNRGFFAWARRALYHVRLFARVCAYIMRLTGYNARGGWAW